MYVWNYVHMYIHLIFCNVTCWLKEPLENQNLAPGGIDELSNSAILNWTGFSEDEKRVKSPPPPPVLNAFILTVYSPPPRSCQDVTYVF